MPRLERMYETKWMQVFRRSGRDEDLVRSFTSTTDMLPTTFIVESSTASDDTPSLSSSVRASLSGLSPLQHSLAMYTGGRVCERLT